MKDPYRTFYERVGSCYPEDDITYTTISGLQRMKWIRAKLQSLGHGSLLDCGCNVGRLSARWKRGAVFGVDISYAVLARGKHQFPDTAFIHGDLRSLSFLRNDSMDVTMTCEVLEHIDRPQDFLNELHRVMKPGAKGLITVPGYTREAVHYVSIGIMRSYGIHTGTKGEVYLHWTYKPDELVNLVASSGFQVLESGSFEKELRLWQKPITWLENIFYYIAKSCFPDSRMNWLFQRTIDRVKIDLFSILDVFGLSFLLKRLFREGRRSYVVIAK